MISTHFGQKIDVLALRQRFKVSTRGLSFIALISTAQRLGLITRALRIDAIHLSELSFPAILHWGGNHFVVLKEIKNGTVTLHNPARGIQKLTFRQCEELYAGIAIEVLPANGFHPSDQRTNLRIGDLVGKIVGLKRVVVQVISLAFVLELIVLLTPFFIRWVVDDVLVSFDYDLLTMLASGFIVLAVVRELVAALRASTLLQLSTDISIQWSVNIFSHLVRLPSWYFERRLAADIVSRFGAAHFIQRTLTTSFVEGAIDGVMAFVTIAMMLAMSPTMTAVVCAVVVAYILLRIVFYPALVQASAEQIIAETDQQGFVLETLRGIQTIKLFNFQQPRIEGYFHKVVDSTNCSARTQKLHITFRSASSGLFAIAGIALVWIGVSQILSGSALTVGGLLAFVAFKDQFVSRVSNLIDRVFDWKLLQLHVERLADILLSKPEDTGATQHEVNFGNQTTIEVDNVSVRYGDSEPEILSGISLTIREGESVAIVGPSGCGKTTLLKVILGLIEPTQGTVRCGGQEINKVGLDVYRSLMGCVMQDDQLFVGSLAENIALFDTRIDMDHVRRCAQDACILDEVEQMPMAFQTRVGDMGSTISGGQKQRILIARALYRNPKILVFDESTSALDVEKEIEVNKAIRALKVTKIVVAHRPETVRMADRVLRIENGAIAYHA